MRNDAHGNFPEFCRQNGWKCTSQRVAVYEFLKGNLSHPDVDTVWNAVRRHLPAITRESVYRILNEFADKGLIARLDHIDHARYDSHTGAHGHFLCSSCGEIADFDWPPEMTLPPEMRRRDLIHMELRLVGICPRCAIAAPEDASAQERNNAFPQPPLMKKKGNHHEKHHPF